MKSLVAACFLVALTGNGRAQVVSPEERLHAITAQRAAIRDSRARLEAGFQAESAECLKKFAVNHCLNDVTLRRRETMANFRREEVSLNDEERKMKGAEQIRKTEEKLSPEQQREAVERGLKASEDYQSRLEREANKKQQRAAAELSEKTARDANAEKLLRNQSKALERSRQRAASDEEAKKYANRQIEAEKRRAERDANKAKPGKPAAKPLPTPAE